MEKMENKMSSRNIKRGYLPKIMKKIEIIKGCMGPHG